MGHEWVKQLSTMRPEHATCSVGTRARAAAVIGEPATEWGVVTGHRMATYILDRLVDWPGDRSDEEYEALRRATEASTLDTLTAMALGDPTVMSQSGEPTQNITFYITRGIALSEVVRNIHTGQEFLIQALLESIESLVSVGDRMRAIKEMTRDVTECWSAFTTAMTNVYTVEQKRWAESRDGRRMQVVDRLLRNVRISAAQARKELGYDLGQEHLAVALWLDGVYPDTARLFDFQALAREIVTVTRSSTPEPLLIRRGQFRADLWLGAPGANVAVALEHRGSWPGHLRMAVGLPHAGLAGFQTTHREAQSARRVAQLAECPERITAYGDVALVSLLASDIDLARVFAASTLGRLAEDETWMGELRKTLAAHIDNGGSVAATARVLHTHRNTVNYRLRQVDELLGTQRDHTQIRCALYLTERFPGAVLAQSSSTRS